ncbi:MAG: glycoside hydrolase family 9 protein [Rubrivivax sp.]|nr:glycoside hydrolase family 9 protein [Rubrivivax sp.]
MSAWRSRIPAAILGLALVGSLHFSPAQAAPTALTPHIHVDQFGYLPRMKKLAIVADPVTGNNGGLSFNPGTGPNQYQVRRWADNALVFSGTLRAWRGGAVHAQSGDRGWVFDFSALRTAGTYYIHDSLNNVSSGAFQIGTTVYQPVLRQALRTFYYQRLNTPKVLPFAQAGWTDAAAFEGARQDRQATSVFAKGNLATARDLSGGWMDAGDTNKYTTFARNAVLQLLDAWRSNPAAFGDANGIPESGNGLPDLLDELKWELEFLKRMQNATGTQGFFLKVGVLDYELVTPLSRDARPRYYVPECTSATLSGAAMMASAAGVFRAIPSQRAYAEDLLTRALGAWNRAKSLTANFSSGFQTNCDTMEVKAGDADHTVAEQIGSALIAAIHLFELTGNTEFRDFVAARYASVEPISVYWWGPYNVPLQQALLRYARMRPASDPVAQAIRSGKAGQNGVMSLNDHIAEADLYRAYMPDDQYHWGSTMIKANVGLMNIDFPSYRLNPAQAALYQEVADQHLHWLHGANPLGLVMLSNMSAFGAESSINEIFHSWFSDGSVWDNAKTSAFGPAPGFLTGGPNRFYSGPVRGISNQPPQKAYKDWNDHTQASYEISEPAIYYQAAYIALLARSMASATATGATPQVGMYADSLAAGWQDWSWNAQRNFANTSPVRSGARSIRADIGPWGGLSLWRSAGPLALTDASVIRFWVYNDAATSTVLRVLAHPDDGPEPTLNAQFSVPSRVWTEVALPRGQVGSPAVLRRLSIQKFDPSPSTRLFFDDLRLEN